MVGEVPVDTGEVVAAEIEGYRQAMSLIQRLGSTGPDFAYSKGLIDALHFMLQGITRRNSLAGDETGRCT